MVYQEAKETVSDPDSTDNTEWTTNTNTRPEENMQNQLIYSKKAYT